MIDIESFGIVRVAYLVNDSDTEAFRMFRAIGSCESRLYEDEDWEPEQFWAEVYG